MTKMTNQLDKKRLQGLMAAAVPHGRRPHGVTMDSQGIVPEALAASARQTGAKLLYLTPHGQNPTGEMSPCPCFSH